jgi:transposase
MTKVKKVAGIDISKAFFDVFVISEQQTACRRFSNNPLGFDALENWLDRECACVMEVTGVYYMRLALYLYGKGFKVSVVNPLIIKRYSQMRLTRAKTDKADARLIAEYASSQDLACWTPAEQYLITLSQLDSISEQLSKQHTALTNQLEAFSQSGMLEKDTKKILLAGVHFNERQQAAVENKIIVLIQSHHAQLMQSLITIPGLGKKTVAMLIVLTGGFTRFRSSKQLAAYVGLAPRIFESGSSVKGRARLCKMGTARIRALLYVCAWSAKRCNKACRELYERLVAKGKAKKLAMIAVANKLLKQAFAIAGSGNHYQQEYVKNICL